MDRYTEWEATGFQFIGEFRWYRRQDDGKFVAERRSPLTPEQIEYGCRAVVEADTLEDLAAECSGQRVAGSWAHNPAMLAAKRERRANHD